MIPAVSHALCAPVPCSPNTAAVLDLAVACAQPSPMGSEHILWALFSVEGYSPRIIGWIARKTAEVYGGQELAADETGDTDYDAGAVLRWFKDRVFATLEAKRFDTGADAAAAAGGGGGAVTLTGAVQRILDITRQISSERVCDGETVYPDGLVATEFIVAAMLVEGTSVAADILCRCSRGMVNSWNLLEAIHMDPSTIIPPRHVGRVSFEAAAVNGGSCGDCYFWEPGDALPDIGDGSWCAAPVPYANWLVPGRFMIGETPGGDCNRNSNGSFMQVELAHLVPDFVDTFVCLRGEWGPMDRFMQKYYPNNAKAAGLKCDVVFFPIEDFHVTREEDLVAVVLDLRRRLRRGERLYMHCRSGHGRTGMVCIPLIASLFGTSAAEAAEFVKRAHDIGRNGGADAGWHLPETPPQKDLVKRVNDFVTQSNIGNEGNSSSSSRRR